MWHWWSVKGFGHLKQASSEHRYCNFAAICGSKTVSGRSSKYYKKLAGVWLDKKQCTTTAIVSLLRKNKVETFVFECNDNFWDAHLHTWQLHFLSITWKAAGGQRLVNSVHLWQTIDQCTSFWPSQGSRLFHTTWQKGYKLCPCDSNRATLKAQYISLLPCWQLPLFETSGMQVLEDSS